LGIETLGGITTKLIERNTTIPTKKSEIFSTAADGQTSVEIHVLQGEREMASGNKTIGRFQLVGIPPAQRGVPQIEVTFDIDANGILHVSAKDLGTGKEQKITIQATSGLTEAEIQNMVKDAEQSADEDKKKKELIEARNKADNAVYQGEKFLKEHKDKIGDSHRERLEAAMNKVKDVMNSDQKSEIDSRTDELMQIWQEVSADLYQKASASSRTPEEKKNTEEKEDKKDKKEDVIDADYEVVDENEKGKKKNK
jgi:molecular chaperone DnaK